MDKKLMKLVVGAALFGLVKVSVIKLKSGGTYENPEFMPIERTDKFGISDKEEDRGPGWTTVIPFEDVDYMH